MYDDFELYDNMSEILWSLHEPMNVIQNSNNNLLFNKWKEATNPREEPNG